MGNTLVSITFEAIGTLWRIDIPDGLLASQREKIENTIKERIEIFDKHYSRFRGDSLVTAISQASGNYELPEDAIKLFELYEKAYDVTKGAVTPLIGQVLSDAGYDANYSLHPGILHTPPAWKDVMSREGRILQVTTPSLLDFGAAGKGYLIDIVAAILTDEGITAFCVDAGGDISYHSAAQNSLRVALENPDDATEAIGTVTILNQSICGSAGNRRQWANFHHIIDPFSLSSPRHLKAVWTIAGTASIADMMTTCLFFKAPEYMLQYFDFDYLLMKADNSIEHSAAFQADLFIQ